MHRPVTRRQLLQQSATGFGYLALAGRCQDAFADSRDPLAARTPHFSPRAKRVVFLCMRGGPSQVESFDYKSKLNADNGKPSRNKGQNYFGSQWKFDRHGENGLWVSELFPHTAKVADDLCVLNGMHTTTPNTGLH